MYSVLFHRGGGGGSNGGGNDLQTLLLLFPPAVGGERDLPQHTGWVSPCPRRSPPFRFPWSAAVFGLRRRWTCRQSCCRGLFTLVTADTWTRTAPSLREAPSVSGPRFVCGSAAGHAVTQRRGGPIRAAGTGSSARVHERRSAGTTRTG